MATRSTIMIVVLGSLTVFSADRAHAQLEVLGTGVGALFGGVVGGAIGGRGGSGVIGAIAGTVIGAVIGNRIGAALDAEDRRRMEQITRASMAGNGSRAFANDRTGVKGRTTVVGSSKDAQGRTCRTVRQEVTKNGTLVSDTVTGCRDASGRWVV